MSDEIQDDRLRLFVGIPTLNGSTNAAHSKMWMSLGRALSARGDEFGFAGLQEIDIQPMDRARNVLLAYANTAEADWLLMVDPDAWVLNDDESGTPAGEQLLNMIDEADQIGAAVVGAPIISPYDGSFNCWNVDKKTREMFGVVPRGMTRVDAVGGSIMAVNLEAIAELQFAFGTVTSEDLTFCSGVRKLGGAVYCDGRVRTAKLGRPQVVTSHFKTEGLRAV